jgi:hypothetical protein
MASKREREKWADEKYAWLKNVVIPAADSIEAAGMTLEAGMALVRNSLRGVEWFSWPGSDPAEEEAERILKNAAKRPQLKAKWEADRAAHHLATNEAWVAKRKAIEDADIRGRLERLDRRDD